VEDDSLLLAGACMANPNQFALVYDAAERDWLLLVMMCNKANVDPNSADYDSRSVLHVAVATGNLRVIQGLMQVGTNINARDRCGPILAYTTARSPELLVCFMQRVKHLLPQVFLCCYRI
jgi:ankyrin repeat protein